MSRNILFISEQKLKDSGTLSENINPKQLLPIVKVCQDKYILPLLGTGLYIKLQNDIISNIVFDQYKILLDDYISDVLVWYTLAELPPYLQYQILNKGVLTRTSEATVVPTFSEVQSLINSSLTNAKFYAQRAIDYLCENQKIFPEYTNPGTGKDTIQPDHTQYECGIFLGNHPVADNRSFAEKYQGTN